MTGSMRWAIALVIVLGIAGGAYWWRSTSRVPPIPVERLTEPRLGNIVRGVIAVGRVEPRTRIEVKSKANASRNWERAQRLHADKLVSDDERDLARDRFDKAGYRVRLLDAQLEGARATVTSMEGKVK